MTDTPDWLRKSQVSETPDEDPRLDEDDVPSSYNEYVEFVKNNDAGAVAKVFQETHVPKPTLELLLNRWREAEAFAEEVGEVSESDGIGGCADELEELL